MTRIICPATDLHPRTKESLELYAPGAVVVPIEVGDQLGYWNALTDYWGEDDLVNIEQDMVITQETVPSFEDCPEPWCVYRYQVKAFEHLEFWDQEHKNLVAEVSDDGWVNMSLGCVKLSKELQGMVALRTLRRVMESCEGCLGSWWHMDIHSARLFILMGYKPHVHGDVEHAHEYGECSCGCGVILYRKTDSMQHELNEQLGTYDLEEPQDRQRMIDDFHKFVERRDASDDDYPKITLAKSS